jgi:hypothetical protein
MKLTEQERGQLLARENRPGHHHFSCCSLCGFIRWRSSDLNKPDDVTMDEDNDVAHCSRCSQVMQRSPEIFEWVIAVMSFKERRKRDT